MKQVPAVETFGPYDILGELAGGAQGVVLKARRRPGGQAVALKLLRRADPKRVALFEQEGRVLAQLRHPNLPAVVELAREGGLPYLAMEYIEGEDLRSFVDRQGVPPFEWTARILQSVAHALHHCHEQGVVHRDVKPANVVVEQRTGRPVLVDFGMLKRVERKLDLRSLEDAAVLLSKTGEIKGTPVNMAPEQISPDRFGPISPRTDVYALGTTLYTLLTGKGVFEASGLPAMLVAVLSQDPPNPARTNPQVPRALADLCVRCLSKTQAERPETALAFAEALADAAGVERLPWIGGGDPRGPRSLAGYEVLGELGRGGMGVVYLVRPQGGGEPLALKLLLSPNPERVARFEREAKVMQTLGRHPGIVGVRTFGLEKGLPYLVMDRIEGGTLEDLIQGGDRDDGLDKLVKIARAVHFAHEAGVIHRDIKPANILLNAGEPAVSDFGMAHDEHETERLTRTGQFMGTVAYMPPEQLAGGKIDRRTDVYALGVMLYQVLSGRGALPYPGSALEAIGLVLEGRPRPLRELSPDLPEPLETFCMRAMAKDPSGRPDTAEDFARELEVARVTRGAASLRPLLASLGVIALLLLTILAWQLVPLGQGAVAESPTPTPSASPTPEASTPAASPTQAPPPGLITEPPPWYRRLAELERPALPLPEGVGFREQEGTYLNGKDGSVLVFAPAGAFRMGADGDKRCEPEHYVLISKGYFIGKYEVTWEQYMRYCDETGLEPPSSGFDYHGERFEAGLDHPVFNVNWREATAYCEWAGLRLPTSAESEYAARGPTSRRFPWGEKYFPSMANLGLGLDGHPKGQDNRDTRDGFPHTAPVGSFPDGVSWCGALDLCGNVHEWVKSLKVDYRRRPPRIDPDPENGTRRIFRGGGWANHPDNGYSAWRRWGGAGFKGTTLGLRVARTHPSDPGHAFGESDRAKVGAYVRTHPGDEAASRIWHLLPD